MPMNEDAIRRIRLAHVENSADTRFTLDFIKRFDIEWRKTTRVFKRKSKLNKM